MARWTTRDPLEEKDYWNSAYVYCGNNPIRYTDPTGMSYDGYEDGNGNYQWFDNHTENTFTDNNTTWTKVTSDKKAWNKATTIRGAVVTGLVILGNNEAEVKKDVSLFPGDSPLFTKEVKLNNADKYTSGWKNEYNSDTGEKDAPQSPEISNTGFSLKFYPTKGGEQNAMGLVKSNWMAHGIEGAIEGIERMLFGNRATNDPIYDMHGGNAINFINKIDGKYNPPTRLTPGVPVYYQSGHK
jgi:hypothetical protein